MKAKRLFAVSLLLNLVLLGVAGFLAERKIELSKIPQPEAALTRPDAMVPAESSHVLPADPLPTATQPFHWSQIESSDYRTYISNLREIGCPELTIRDIITADVDALYTQKRGQLQERESHLNLGSVSALFSTRQALQSQRQKLWQEESDVIACLVGPPSNDGTLLAETTVAVPNDHPTGQSSADRSALPENPAAPVSGFQNARMQIQNAGMQNAVVRDSTVFQSPRVGNSTASYLATRETASPGASDPQKNVKVSMPAAFQNIDPGTISLNDSQANALGQIRQDFISATGGENQNPSGENQNPSDPHSVDRWQYAQMESDNEMSTKIGGQAFLTFQLQGAQQAAQQAAN